MRNYLKIAFVTVFAAAAGYGVYTSQKSEVMSDLAMANVEALADPESSDCNNKNGYRQWSTSGFLEHKKEFYDCCSKLQEGYNPKDNCR